MGHRPPYNGLPPRTPKDGFEGWCDNTFGESAGGACGCIIVMFGLMCIIGLVGAFFGGCQGGSSGGKVIHFKP